MSGVETIVVVVICLLIMSILGLVSTLSSNKHRLAQTERILDKVKLESFELHRSIDQKRREAIFNKEEINILIAERKILRRFVYRITNSLEGCFNKLSYDDQFGLPHSLLKEIREEVTAKRERDEKIAVQVSQVAYEIPHSTTTKVTFDEVYNTIIQTHKKAYCRDFEGIEIEISDEEMNKLDRSSVGVRVKNTTLKINGIQKSIKIWT